MNFYGTNGSQQFCLPCTDVAVAVGGGEHTEPNDSLILGLWGTVPKLEETANE